MTFHPPTATLCRVVPLVLALVVPRVLAAEAPARSRVAQPKSGDFVFSLLPKAFQQNPDLEMTVNTEVTPYGRLLRTPTAENPMYYVAFDTGYKELGDNVGGLKPPPKQQIENAMIKALARNGYVVGTPPQHAPSLAVLYFWGSHSRMDREEEARYPQLAAKHRLERAMLVGGHNFVDRTSRVLEWGESLTDRTADYEYLRDQTNEDLYFVVASAYDYNALAHKDRKLVWRTTMTVSARGVAMDESMQPLIATAAPYFGRETAEPKIELHRIERWGVHVGEPQVIDDKFTGPTPSSPAPAKGPGSVKPAQPGR